MSDRLKVNLSREEYDSLLALVKAVKDSWPSNGYLDKPVAKIKLKKVEQLSGIIYRLELAEMNAQRELSEKEALELLMKEPEITKREVLEKVTNHWTAKSEKIFKRFYKSIREAAEEGKFRVGLSPVLWEMFGENPVYDVNPERWHKGLEFVGILDKIKELGFTYIAGDAVRYPAVA
jgi:hypothetical protein